LGYVMLVRARIFPFVGPTLLSFSTSKETKEVKLRSVVGISLPDRSNVVNAGNETPASVVSVGPLPERISSFTFCNKGVPNKSPDAVITL